MKKISQRIILLGLIIYILSALVSISGIAIGVAIGVFGLIPKVFMRWKEAKKFPFNLPIICFVLTLVLSSLLCQSPIIGLEKTEAIIRRIALYYLVILGCNLIWAKRLTYLLLVSSAIWAGYIILQYLWDIELFNLIIPGSKNIGSARSIGETLGMVIPICLCCFLFASSLYRRIWFGAILLLFTFLLLLTLTRGAWLSLIFATIFIALVKGKKVWLFILLFLAIAFSFSVTRNRALSIFDLKDSSNQYRIHMWKEGLKIFRNNPLFGIGPGNFKIPYGKNVSAHCHNILLNVAAESGIIGLVAFIWLIASIFYYLFNSFNNNPIKLGITASSIGWFFYGMVDLVYAGRLGYLFWFLLGVFVVLQRNGA